MKKLSKEIKKEDGFIAIMALGIFALLAVFGFIVQGLYRDTVRSIIDTNNFTAAQDLANSVAEYIQDDLTSRGPGYNSGLVECIFDEDGNLESATLNAAAQGEADPESNPPTNVGDIPGFCTDNFADVIPANKRTVVRFEVIGRQKVAMTGKVECTSGWDSFENTCFAVPSIENNNHGSYQCEGIDNENLEHSCNWGILRAGDVRKSSVSLNLFYDNSNALSASSIHEPFDVKENNLAAPAGIVFRLRTPCSDHEEGDCNADERVAITENPSDDQVLSWTLMGEHDECAENPGDSCIFTGKVGNSVFLASVVNSKRAQAYKLLLNGSLLLNSRFPFGNFSEDNNILLDPAETTEIDTKSGGIYEASVQLLDQPSISINFDNILLDSDGEPISHLEYQLLTSQPVANIKTDIFVYTEVDGNVFYSEFEKYQESDALNAVLNF